MRDKIEVIIGGEGKIAEYTQSAEGVRVEIELKNKALITGVRRAVEELFAMSGTNAQITVREVSKAVAKPEPKLKHNGAANIKRVIAVTSAKGGVGKSSVSVAIARALRAKGQSVGVLDADIYGPSQPSLLGMQGAMPEAQSDDMMIPPVSQEGIKLMSIGYFVDSNNALVWRGPMATSALKQLIHQSQWGELDTLVIDMPPGTGDIHLSLAAELKIDEAIIVTTPSDLALADVIRGVSMLRNESFGVKIMGIVNNMAYFSPADAPEKRYEIFGSSDSVQQIAEENSLEVIVQVPITGKVGDAIDPAYFSEIV